MVTALHEPQERGPDGRVTDNERAAWDHLRMTAERFERDHPDRHGDAADREREVPQPGASPAAEADDTHADAGEGQVARRADAAGHAHHAADLRDAGDADDVGDAGEGGDDGDVSDPRESAYALLQRGHDLMRSRHHAQAATVLARAARIEPRKGSILEALGRAYYNSGQHERAAETFEALLDVDPSAHYAHYALGQSLKQLDRPREARTHLRLAVALSPYSRLYQGALDRLGTSDPA